MWLQLDLLAGNGLLIFQHKLGVTLNHCVGAPAFFIGGGRFQGA